MATVRRGNLMAREEKRKKLRSNQSTKIKLPRLRRPKDAAVTQDEGRRLGEGNTVRPVATSSVNLGEGE